MGSKVGSEREPGAGLRQKRHFRLPGGALARWVTDVRGATAVEFGLVSLPCLALLGGIIQFAFMIWANQNLDFVFQRTARNLFTGQFQTANKAVTDSATLLATLKTTMCANSTVFDCSGIKIDVALANSFASSLVTSPIDSSTKDWASGFGTHYVCASPGAIVVARAAVKFPVFFNLLNLSLADFADGSVLLQSTLVFRTEPYASGSPC